MTQKDIKLIENFINKKEPRQIEFEEAQAIVKLLFEIYWRCK